jgi:hypothetical protein
LIQSVYGLMVKRKYPRIEVSQRTYDLLSLESVFIHKPIREILDELVESYITNNTRLVYDQRTKLVSDQTAIKTPIISKPVKVEKAAVTAYKASKPAQVKKGEVVEYKTSQPPRVKKLGSDLEAQARIKELYDKGISVNQIAREIGIAPSTIRSWMDKQFESGEMVRRGK